VLQRILRIASSGSQCARHKGKRRAKARPEVKSSFFWAFSGGIALASGLGVLGLGRSGTRKTPGRDPTRASVRPQVDPQQANSGGSRR
jgi:hypothetical protein